VVLVKALPHRSSDYFETVCCAGVGRDFRWRRLYPVPFRVLEEEQQFSRWSWVRYKFTSPSNDPRRESQKVDPASIVSAKQLNAPERSRLARMLTRMSTAEAEARGESLTLVKPKSLSFSWRKKSEAELSEERIKHNKLASQISFLNKTPDPLEPCPYDFSVDWTDQLGSKHTHTCDDWETSTAFFRRRMAGGDAGALSSLRQTYEDEYLQRGMRLALGTHSRRNKQWLLVGMIRVDDDPQAELSL
jgi:hypothetical protein